MGNKGSAPEKVPDGEPQKKRKRPESSVGVMIEQRPRGAPIIRAVALKEMEDEETEESPEDTKARVRSLVRRVKRQERALEAAIAEMAAEEEEEIKQQKRACRIEKKKEASL